MRLLQALAALSGARKSPSDTETESQPEGSSALSIAKIRQDGIPRTLQEAQEDIEQIRGDKSLSHVGVVKDLEAAIGVISDMYHKPTHFLLELLQNADDNVYDAGVEPRMRITYKNRTIRFDTNEIGFSKTNIKAICSIGDSSKTAPHYGAGSIGEKGIGFKSVFKVAEVVWVNSGHYQFKFHAKKTLGRLSPTWAEFPEKRLDKLTSILLYLHPDLNIEELLRELKALDAKLLMFLRQLQKIDIAVHEDRSTWHSSLTKHQQAMEGYSGMQSLTLQPDSFSPYAVFSHKASHLPNDPRRKGRKEADIILAFPSPYASHSAVFTTQHVYAFLPVRDYGFKFILHADFALIANREDIDSSAAWNKALLEEVPQALLKAINRFNFGNLRYGWLPYIPLGQSKQDFFQDLQANIIKLLSTQPTLESSTGILRCPVELTSVSRNFLDDDGRPLIPAGISKFAYVSHKYPDRNLDTLKCLGVTPLSDQDFIDDLASFTSQRKTEFRQMPLKWHSRLSQVLNSLLTAHRKTISTLRIVPLVDGRWIAPSDGPLICLYKANKFAIPKGIRAFQVHPDAVNDLLRRNLLETFGLRDVDTREVCDMVIRTHEDIAFHPESIPMEDLISHVTFLQQAGWPFLSNKPGCDLWLMTESGSYCRSSQIYVDSELPYSATSVFARHKPHFCFLHQDYAKALSKHDNWAIWMSRSLGVEIIPRLITLSPAQDGSFTIADDFIFVLHNCSSSDVLQLLGWHWSSYSKWIIPENDAKDTNGINLKVPQEESKSKLIEIISSMKALCLDGAFFPLAQTYLPRESVLVGLGVDIPDSELKASLVGETLTTISDSLKNTLGMPVSEGHKAGISVMNIGPDVSPAKASNGDQSIELHFLNVPNVESSMWDFLAYFNVTVILGLKDCIYRLRRLRAAPVTRHLVSLLYSQITNYASIDNLGYIQQSFKDHELIYIDESIDASAHGKWIDMDGCVWQGPSCLKKIPRLNYHWKEQRSLFCDLLKLPDASLKTLVDEAKQIIHTDSLEYIHEMFFAICRFIDEVDSLEGRRMVYELRDHQIFPIWTRGCDSNYSTFDSLKSGEESWFIPDHEDLRLGFEGVVPLLAFRPSTITRLAPLIKIAFKDRLLSSHATSDLAIEGEGELNHNYTRELREKAHYIACLVPWTVTDRTTILDQLSRVQVYRPNSISLRLVIKTGSHTFEGHQQPGRVGLRPEARALKIYIMEEDGGIRWPPVELTQQLSAFCGISDIKHVSLLAHILVQANTRRIEEDLKKQGILSGTGHSEEVEKFEVADGFEKQRHAVNDQKTPAALGFVKRETGKVSAYVSLSEETPDSPPPIIISESKVTTDFEGTVVLPVNGKHPSSNSTNQISDAFKKMVERLNGKTAASLCPSGSRNIALIKPRNTTEKLQHDQIQRHNVRRAYLATTSAEGTGNEFPEMDVSKKFPGPRDVYGLEDSAIEDHDVEVTNGYLTPLRPRSPRNDFKTMKHGVISVSPPSITFRNNEDDKEIQFIAELYVSKLLEKVLKDDYQPKFHWTSSLRTRAGYNAYGRHENRSTFTIHDRSGNLTNFLTSKGYAGASYLGDSPTFHIEVCASVDDVKSAFTLERGPSEMARKYTLVGKVENRVQELFIVARVGTIYNSPKIALFVDPWQIHKNGLLSLESYHGYWASFSNEAPVILMAEPRGADGIENIYKNYSMEPSTEIRLLELQRGEGDSPLRGDIRIAQISSLGRFWALSYVWGMPCTDAAEYDLETPYGKILITLSLYLALKSIRERGVLVPIWADAVCINQLDNIEKSLQIRLMGQIYESAERVVAWLGTEEDNSHQAMETLEKIGTTSSQAIEASQGNELTEIPPLWSSNRVPSSNDRIWGDINSLLGRSWFTRVWVTQELVRGSDVFIVCGKSELRWEHFFVALKKCEEELNKRRHSSLESRVVLSNAGPAFSLGETRTKLKQRSEYYSMLELLELFAYTKATLERDKLFALRGLAYDVDDTIFDPDYISSDEHVIRQYAAGFIKNREAMSLLYRAGTAKSYPFCSWIPSWTKSPFPQTISDWDTRKGRFYAGRRTPTDIILSKIEGVLEVKGICIDTIIKDADIRMGTTDFITFVDAMADIQRAVESLGDSGYPTKETLGQLIVWMPIGNAKRPHLESEGNRSYRSFATNKEECWPEDLEEHIFSITPGRDASTYNEKPLHVRQTISKYWQTVAAFAHRISDTKFCVTRERFAGFIPGKAQVGDKICLFHGGRVPFIVREIDSGYSLIGECYIHGLMYDGAQSFKHIKEQTFALH